ncbi:MAG TPA: DUF4129 domain-containing protein [Blastocatellia bacterium]|nr:DUF4129 domain-containing protein [Blastocatellia bacterium]
MRKVIPASLIILFFALTAFGAGDIADYSNRVSLAKAEVDSLIESRQNESDRIDKIKTLLPRSEQVEAEGQSITVDNGWLHMLVDTSRNDSDSDRRENKLREASGRLAALGEHLEHIQSQSQAPEGAAGAREKLREIRSRKEFMTKGEDPITKFIREMREKAFNFIQRIWDAVTNALFGGSSGTSWVFRVLIMAGVVGAVILAIRTVKRMKRTPKKREKKRTVLGEEIEAGTTSNDLAEAALAAAKAGDFRGAVRKLYISLLYELSERNLIELEPNTTNHEYLAKVSRFQPLVAPMRYLTDRFDYFWYGMFPSTAEDFSTFQARYNEAMDRVRTLKPQAGEA